MSAGTRAYLVVRRDDGFGDVFPLAAGQTYTLGRATTNRIVLKDDQCSREHAEVGYSGDRWRIRDLNSHNGTRVNGVRLDGEWELAPQDDVYLGRTHLLFVEDMTQLPGLEKVETLRTEFAEWLRRYLSILSLPGHVCLPGATSWFGVMQKCCNYVDALVSACCEGLLPVAGDAGVAVVQKITAGKPLDRITLGQVVQILEALDTIVSPKLRVRLPNVLGQARVLGRDGITMLHELSRKRNDFAHRRWEMDGYDLAFAFLTTASELCSSRLVAITVALEEVQAEIGGDSSR